MIYLLLSYLLIGTGFATACYLCDYRTREDKKGGAEAIFYLFFVACSWPMQISRVLSALNCPECGGIIHKEDEK